MFRSKTRLNYLHFFATFRSNKQYIFSKRISWKFQLARGWQGLITALAKKKTGLSDLANPLGYQTLPTLDI